MKATITEGTKEIGTIEVVAKNFKTGRNGYYGSSTVVINGKPYHVNILLYELGTKASK